jgi:ribonuclease HI
MNRLYFNKHLIKHKIIKKHVHKSKSISKSKPKPTPTPKHIRFDTDNIVYTDASIIKDNCGIGIWFPLTDESFQYRIKLIDINYAELFAIYVALLISTKQLTVYTDSLTAINLLCKINYNNKYADLLLKIHNIMSTRTVNLIKVKAHSGDKGNDIADSLARASIIDNSPFYK